MTLILGRSDLLSVLDTHTCVDRLWSGFTAEPASIEGQRVRTDLPGPGTATALLPGLLPDVPAYSVKVNAKFPDARPAVRGVVCLHDLVSGELLALLDSATLTAWRTGLAAALGTHSLARYDADVLGIVGCGAQAGLFARGLIGLRPISEMVVTDIDRERADAFAGRCSTEFGVAVRIVDDAAAVAAQADIVLTATLDRDDARPGAHYTSLGADEPGKVELSADLLRASRLIVDDLKLAVAGGPVGNAGLDGSAVHGTLRDVLTGAIAARDSDDTITVYAPIGLPWQDLALAWLAYRAAEETEGRGEGGTGTRFEFLE
ncbi:ornithine cyclodeaminase [Nocardiopsis gilva YIM 90087]|uniref:Ornithine cyclodeaminase n=1 Tax=Nocardiopsis gilva YIM 90087 TaxID=1235441 RepID=A0A223S4S0_9ACTN|nr:ornithine cyclodeaminase family protein [Nocardiopsis gilva]ASU83108.1 ornithine cyclodeaminase [Nocardiopsis gilva YIM 90087]